MYIQIKDAERMLDVRTSTFYSRVKKLDIKLTTKIDKKWRSSCIDSEDLQKIANAMWRTLEKEAEEEPVQHTEKTQNKNGAAQESERQENFMLQLKIKEKEEALKASYEVINVYKNQNQKLQIQRDEAKSEFQLLYTDLIATNNKATAFRIACIALATILILFMALVIRGKLRF